MKLKKILKAIELFESRCEKATYAFLSIETDLSWRVSCDENEFLVNGEDMDDLREWVKEVLNEK